MIVYGKEKEIYEIKGSTERKQGLEAYVRGPLIQKTPENPPVVIISRMVIAAEDEKRQDRHRNDEQGEQNETEVPFLPYAMHFRIPASSASSSGQLSSSSLKALSFARFAIPERMSICCCEAAVRRIK